MSPRSSRRRAPRPWQRGLALGASLAFVAAGAALTQAHAGPLPASGVTPPQANASFDYQIGGAYALPDGVRAVSRDRSAAPAKGAYNICYVNAFQTQPGKALDDWRKNHPDLLLHDGNGKVVMDDDWGEALLDTSTDAKRTALAGIVGAWIDGCAKKGFQAVEPDNLDSYTRSHKLLTGDDAVAFAHALTQRAHRDGLAVAQKNTTELLDRRKETGFDFAVAEECAHYDECGAFQSAYGNRVFEIEYAKQDFEKACAADGGKESITLRDRDVLPAGESGHVDERC